jgi:hypothetical protein
MRSPGQQARGVDLGGEVGERERDSLVLDDRLAEGLALNRIVARELQRCPRDPDRLGGDHRTCAFERSERR